MAAVALDQHETSPRIATDDLAQQRVEVRMEFEKCLRAAIDVPVFGKSEPSSATRNTMKIGLIVIGRQSC